MALRFQRLLVKDSDEDSSASHLQQSRNQTTGAELAQEAAQPPETPTSAYEGAPLVEPASVTAPAPARVATAPAEVTITATRTATPLNLSVTSSKNFDVESTSQGIDGERHPNVSTDFTSVSFREDPIPRPGALQFSSQQSFNYSAASPVSAQSMQSERASIKPESWVSSRAGLGSPRNTIPTPTANANASASHDDAKGSAFFSGEEQAQQPAAITDGATPIDSGAFAMSDGTGERGTKAMQRKVVVRGKKEGDTSDPGVTMRVDGDVALPERTDDASPAAASVSLQQASPTYSSSRSRQVAKRSSGSPSALPAEEPRTPGGVRGAEVAFKSERSLATNGSATGSPFPYKMLRPGARLLNHVATPRSITTGAETPLELETKADTTAGTPNFRTDDTHSLHFDARSSTTPRRRGDSGSFNTRRRPQIPSPSALDDSPTPLIMDESGQAVPIHRPKVRQTTTADGRETWMLYSPRRGDANADFVQEIPAPPLKLSQRAQDILAAKRRALEDGAKRRAFEDGAKRRALEDDAKHRALEDDAKKREAGDSKRRAVRKILLNVSRRSRSFDFLPAAFYTEDVAHKHGEEAAMMRDKQWTSYVYDGMAVCTAARRASGAARSRQSTELVVRTLQPVQSAPAAGTTGTCECVVYDWSHVDEALRQLIDSSCAREDGVRRYLNLQPMQLANVETQHMVDPQLESPRRGSASPSEAQSAIKAGQKSAAEQRGLATLGGLWCTVEALRENGRPVKCKDMGASRRILRVCGGQALRVPLHEGSSEMFDVRCYELLLFPRESLSPSAVNYGSEGLTLGQVVSPPASSFPLTPRIIDDLVTLKEYRKRLLTKSREVAFVNFEDDRITFASAAGADGKAGVGARQYLTLTTVSISSRRKYTIELTLLMLPFRSGGIFGGKAVAEVPRFCAATVMSHRRLLGLSLSFSTRSAFMSAYKALLWATECDIVDVQPADGEYGFVHGAAYSKLRVCATTSPMMPWVASFGKQPFGQPKEETFHGSCLDFAALTLAAPPETVQKSDGGERDPLTLKDFVISEAEHNGSELGSDTEGGLSGALARQQRRSSIFTSTLDLRKAADANEGGALPTTDTVVGLTAFGVIRRAVSQKTSEVFDVRVMPRNRGRIAPTTCNGAGAKDEHRAVGGHTARSQEEHLLQQDAEAAIMVEYVSRLPFHSRVYGVLVDDQRYYIFQEPWISALSLEESMRTASERDALKYNEGLSKMLSRTTIMSLKDFIHAILCPDVYKSRPKEEVWLEIARVLAAQLLLLLTSLHGKGMLLGPCPPQRLLVRVTGSADESEEAEEESSADTPERATPEAPLAKSSSIQLFVPDIGISTLAWSYERQQCGVLEYLSPMYVLRQMLSDSIGTQECTWTVRDDWWTYLTLCFELFAGDGSALVAPETAASIPTPAPTLTNFFSPVDILDVWQKVIADSAAGVFSTAAETIAMRTRRYVHQRVLKSVSRFVDSLVMKKAEEVQYFGSAGFRPDSRVVRAVPPPSGGHDKSIGVSLAAMYLKGTQEKSEASSVAFGSEDGDVAAEDILISMRWLFQVRDFFDTILDAVFSPTPCSVHGPPLRLVSHPFFQGVQLAKVFDGSYTYSAAVSDYAEKHLSKRKLHAALLAYRTRAYRGPAKLQADMPLMITSSAYNAFGGAKTGVPLLMLSSLTSHDDQTARENEDSSTWPDAVNPTEGLVLSRTNSMAFSGVPSPRSQSPATGVWGQQRLKALYDPTEWQCIAALETEVRGALSSYGPRESISSRRASAEADYASSPVNFGNRNRKPVQRYSGLVHTEIASLTSSGRRRDPLEDEHSADSKAVPTSVAQPQLTGFGSTSSSFRGDTAAKASQSAFRHTNTTPFVEGWEHEGSYKSCSVPWRASQHGAAPVVAVEQAWSSRREVTPSRPRHRHADTRELERSLNELARGCSHRRESAGAAFLPRRNGGVALGYGPGYYDRRMHSSQHGSRPSSRDSSRPQSEMYNHQQSWPKEFLDAATLQNKGRPRRLLDQHNTITDRTMVENERQSSVHSLGSNSPHGGGIARAASRRYGSRESSSQESYLLVPSDGEVDTESAMMSTYHSNDMYRESPAPRNPRDSRTTQLASDRTAYFQF
ncbi:hypothetical protein CUR178_02138 [Leishmania enriettii]|uniref:Protein kinase domain-containing protein n=1 Tax=Leishmania enriettii TaxID=5663 RepID=A0A836GCD9_LEIEN|nr:hypothetical protein CUR178_02138 [Leishmania enriettii]